MRVASSVSIDRTSLGLGPLVLNNDPHDGAYTYPEDGLAIPNFDLRRTYAPDSAWAAGRMLLGAVLDQAMLPLTVAVIGTSAATLKARKDELAAALGQFAYSVTVTVGGVVQGTWPAEAATVWWGVVDHGDAQIFHAVGTTSIPVNPPTAEVP